MIVPPDVQIKCSIKTGRVYHFVHDDIEGPHFFVILNDQPVTDESIVMVVATSKIKKVRKHNKNMPVSTLVRVQPNEYAVLSCETIFNCNKIIPVQMQTLVDRLESGELLVKDPLPQTILSKIIDGVHDSPLVSDEVKKYLPARKQPPTPQPVIAITSIPNDVSVIKKEVVEQTTPPSV